VTGGIPRLVNIVCDGALLLGYARDRLELGAEEIREVARDLELAEAEPAAQPAPAAVGGPAPRRRRFFGLFG
jgi:hypothetical protein